jgi:N-acetylglucosaminyldiphosphoundecaprenol N-acetyl-beta-D-mannosaminyltransferase
MLGPAPNPPADDVTEQPFEFGGLKLARMDLSHAVDWVTTAALARSPGVVVTPNINHLHLIHESQEAHAAIGEADLQLADGWPIVAASRILGEGLPERVPGIDLVERLVDGEVTFSIAVLGGPAGSATKLAQRAERTNRVALVDELQPGWDRPERMASLVSRIKSAAPNLTFLGIGAPRQEVLAHRLKPAVAGPIICCGAAIEVLAGVRPRAPQLLQRLGLEWAFRLAIEPRRLYRRYGISAVTFLRLMCRRLGVGTVGGRPA